MFSVSKISMFVSGKDLFKDISFMIQPKDRIGLVGKNGAGKSTMLKIIAGFQEPSSGSIDISNDKTVGYLPQEMHFAPSMSVYNETITVFAEINKLEEEEKYIGEQLTIRTDYESESYHNMIDRLNDIHIRLDHLDADKIEQKTEKILKGLGFTRDEFDMPLSSFSGGWQMRVELAKILLTQPSLLLLDEPTNHLDIESIMWLEEYFMSYPGAIMMVSHDRRFLDNITNRTIEIVFGKIYDYPAPYTKYLTLRQERYDNQIATMKNQQKYIDQQEKFITRFKAKASKAKAVQSKIKLLEKVDRVELDEFETASIQFKFPPAPRSGQLVVEAKGLSKAYGDKQVLRDVNEKILRGERIAFVGKNGMGKSTLIRIITKETDCDGEIILGHNVEMGYYAQIQEKTLNENDTVLQSIENEAVGDWSKNHRIRGLLGAFLFGEEDVDKKVKVLSGGEKSRLALAKMLLKENNLLILDEPTNHLDIAAKEVLKNALIQYDGTLIVVSHDRDFLTGLTSKTLEFTADGLKEHLGDIDEFLNKYKLDHFREFELNKKAEKEKSTKKPSSGKADFENRKNQDKELKQLKNDLSKCEKKIAELEDQIAKMESNMSNPEFYENEDASKKAFFEHSNLKSSLDRKLNEWEKIGEKIEKLEAQ
ncbi:MAG: ABC-F family ATP-binding cassette domain-containing protein [Flavobacteriales bacterium]|nr:ABC-F family ATP-binding cassette domain-containing protein [Flavobacteriales bacterium]